MNPINALKKLATTPSYFFGRFYTARQAYSFVKAQQKAPTATKVIDKKKDSLFDIDTKRIVEDLRKDAIAIGINLPQPAVEEVYQFAKQQPLGRWTSNDTLTFRYQDVVKGKVGNENVAIAEVLEKEKCPTLHQIANDPLILQAVKDYLGYEHISQEIRLFWTFAGELSNQERISLNQTIEYHFDVHSWNFCYLHIYITDCNIETGAHQMVLGSHKDKPTSWLWGSAKKSDEEIHNYYTKAKVLTLEGRAGTGFLEDTSCYHRALAPQKGNRLLFQVRYF